MLHAAGALSAKAKAMYGKRITPSMYEELVRKRNIYEIASYLKSETQYYETLKEIHENTIHRGQLESLLRQDMYQRLQKMVKFVDRKHRSYYMVTMKQVEIDQILSRIRVISTQDFSSALASVPLYLDPLTKVNFAKLMSVNTYDELLEVLKTTEYYEILKAFQPKKDIRFDYTACESALQRMYITYIFDVIDDCFTGNTRKSLKQMWSTRVELDNLTKIYRYKMFFQAPYNIIVESLIACDGKLSPAKLEQLLAAPTTEAFMKDLAESVYHIQPDESQFIYIEYFADCIKYHAASKSMHYDTAAPIIFSAYHLLAEREVENLINIIEGVRYNVPYEEIQKMLIYE